MTWMFGQCSVMVFTGSAMMACDSSMSVPMFSWVSPVSSMALPSVANGKYTAWPHQTSITGGRWWKVSSSSQARIHSTNQLITLNSKIKSSKLVHGCALVNYFIWVMIDFFLSVFSKNCDELSVGIIRRDGLSKRCTFCRFRWCGHCICNMQGSMKIKSLFVCFFMIFFSWGAFFFLRKYNRPPPHSSASSRPGRKVMITLTHQEVEMGRWAATHFTSARVTREIPTNMYCRHRLRHLFVDVWPPTDVSMPVVWKVHKSIKGSDAMNTWSVTENSSLLRRKNKAPVWMSKTMSHLFHLFEVNGSSSQFARNYSSELITLMEKSNTGLSNEDLLWTNSWT